jgi:hypothetical protein
MKHKTILIPIILWGYTLVGAASNIFLSTFEKGVHSSAQVFFEMFLYVFIFSFLGWLLAPLVSVFLLPFGIVIAYRKREKIWMIVGILLLLFSLWVGYNMFQMVFTVFTGTTHGLEFFKDNNILNNSLLK